MDRLDEMSPEDAGAALRRCCGASAWVAQTVARRPFRSEAALLEAAEEVWWGLAPDDWEEAFAAHPRIGEREGAGRSTARWSAGEQAGAASAQEGTRRALSEGNRAYEERFGRTYIVCATGRSAEEMLGILQERLRNDPGQELRAAAEEQRKITRIRLGKLLTELEPESQ